MNSPEGYSPCPCLHRTRAAEAHEKNLTWRAITRAKVGGKRDIRKFFCKKLNKKARRASPELSGRGKGKG